MSLSFATWLIILIPMPLVVLLCLVSYLRNLFSNPKKENPPCHP
jgi:hypothetical protein